MNYPALITSQRLVMQPVTLQDDVFILELLNTEGWLQFIGNRNIAGTSDAQAYIQRISDNPDICYWSVKPAEDSQPIGVITFVKRDYLEHPDFGFAFLPQYSGKGYAYEAARAVATAMVKENGLERLLAIILPQNTRSINLITKLGWTFEKEIEADNEKLYLYGVRGEVLTYDKMNIDSK